MPRRRALLSLLTNSVAAFSEAVRIDFEVCEGGGRLAIDGTVGIAYDSTNEGEFHSVTDLAG